MSAVERDTGIKAAQPPSSARLCETACWRYISRKRYWLAAEVLFVGGWAGVWAAGLDLVPLLPLAVLSLAAGLLLIGVALYQDARTRA